MKIYPTLLAAALLAAAACVPYPQSGPSGAGTDVASSSGTAAGQPAFAPLDDGESQVNSLHCSVHAYGDDDAHQASAAAETYYNNIITDTGLYSFIPQYGAYPIYVYANQAEYIKKTGQPQWSNGVISGNAIYTYMGPQLDETLAYELTHVIFYEYMRYPGGDVNPQHAWLEEGLAIYEQGKAASGGAFPDAFFSVRPTMIQSPLPMDQLLNLAPNTNQDLTSSEWYCEAENMVQFMIEHGGHLGFSQFLVALQNGQTLDQAIATGYPGNWSNLEQFYGAWKSYILQ